MAVVFLKLSGPLYMNPHQLTALCIVMNRVNYDEFLVRSAHPNLGNKGKHGVLSMKCYSVPGK